MARDGAIGVEGGIPWRYPADQKRFKCVTWGAVVIMGRRTFESLGGRPLPGRRNIVISRSDLPDVETFASLTAALRACGDQDVWLIGGRRIYEEGMALVDVIDITYVPETVGRDDAVHFPDIDPAEWEAGPRAPLPEDPRLEHQVFRRRAADRPDP